MPRRSVIIALALVGSACLAGSSPDADRAAAQLAAASRIASEIARNPGPLEALCVAYSGDWEDPPLPANVGLAVSYAEGCEEVDGQLFAQGGRARAVWVGVGVPEDLGSVGGVVPVFTSTGVDDAASYRCPVSLAGSAWVAEACEAGPVG